MKSAIFWIRQPLGPERREQRDGFENFIFREYLRSLMSLLQDLDDGPSQGLLIGNAFCSILKCQQRKDALKQRKMANYKRTHILGLFTELGPIV
jgi:hypothetical protein